MISKGDTRHTNIQPYTELRTMRIPVHLALIAILVAACGTDSKTISPTRGAITESAYASGVVKAQGQYQAYPVVSGRVIALLVQEGDTVKAGQPLLRLDDRTSSLSENNAYAQLHLLQQNVREEGPVLSQLRAAVDQARDKLSLDSANYVRQKALWDQKIGSRSEFDQRELVYTTSKSAYDRATKAVDESRQRLRTELDVARNNLAISTAGNDDRTPCSLIDGIIYDLLIEPGELATTQKPLAIIGSATDLYLELEVDEYDIRRIAPGQLVYVSLDSYADSTFEAKVSRIIPYMDERSRTFKVEARFVQRPPLLYPNLTAEANIVLEVRENALRIPASYVVDGDQVLTGPDTKAHVQLGLRDMQFVEVLGGIDEHATLYQP